LTQEPEWLFPFEGMTVGDSFFIPTLKPAQMLYVIDTCSKRAGIRTRSYVAQKEGYLGVRTWRVG
jgi:hypothetical protein